MISLLFLTVVGVVWRCATASDNCPELLGCRRLISVLGQPPAGVPWYSKAVVTDVCSRYEEFVQCLETLLPNCGNSAMKLLYQGLRDAYDFICNDGNDDYVLYQPCFANPGVQSEAGQCNATLSANLQNLQQYNTSYARARLCQYSDNYIDCVGNVIKSFCSLAAKTWQRKFDMKTLCPVLVSQACTGWATQCHAIGSSYKTSSPQSDTSPTWSIIVLSLSVSLTSLIIVVAVVILACFCLCPACRRRRSSQQQQQQTSSRRSSSLPGVDMPPPYPGPFFPGHINAAAATPSPLPAESSAPPSLDLWFVDMDDLSAGVDGARGGADLGVDKKRPLDEDEDEGHFVPDAVEMNAKLEEAIPPPPHLDYDQRRPHHHQCDSHHQRPVYEQRQRQRLSHAPDAPDDDYNYFVPAADTTQDRSSGVVPVRRPRSHRGAPAAAAWSPSNSSTAWRRQASTDTTGVHSDSMTGGTASLSAYSGGGFTSSSSSRRLSPPSLYMPSSSTQSSSSVSSQSRFVLSDDPDTTQTDVDYY